MKKYIVYCHVFPNGKRYVGGLHFQHFEGGDVYGPKTR